MTTYFESCRGQVRPADCNENGALGTPALTARLGDAASSALLALGHGPRHLREQGAHLQIHTETIERKTPLRAGDVFHVETRLADDSASGILLEHRVLHTDTGVLAATATTGMEKLDGIGLGPSPALQDKPGMATYIGRVSAAECDQMRHMNVQYYMDKGAQALAQFAAAAGFDEKSGAVFHPLRERILFEREVYAGDVLAVRTAVRSVEADGVHLTSVLEAMEAGAVAARFDTVAGLWDPKTGALSPLTDAMRRRIETLPVATEVDFPLPRPIDGPRLPQDVPDHAKVTCRRSVNTWEVDSALTATSAFQIGCVSDAAMHFFTHMGADHEWRAENDIGSAALDYDIHYHQPLHIGAPVELHTHFLELLSKPFRFGHHLINATTGAVATTIEVTAVLFDLTARKAIVLPDTFREKAHAMGAQDGRKST
ncbi:MAG: hypothetical protein OQK53_03300 [Rhodospirillales bacterium]|nr:hypothetical protein [Rhodospirillales bacterium]